jgi:ribosomal protein S18 acetylase RimI-like enzyme
MDHRRPAATITLEGTTAAHLRQMMSWFADAQACRLWGGTEFRYPFTEETFVADSRCESLPSYSLLGDGDRLLGFGQYYDRRGRCHLSRLAISPDHRGQGLGTQLIAQLVELGAPVLHADQCSLFVARTNPAAARLYARLGFVIVPYPDDSLPLAGIDYMIAPCAQVRTRAAAAEARRDMPTR